MASAVRGEILGHLLTQQKARWVCGAAGGLGGCWGPASSYIPVIAGNKELLLRRPALPRGADLQGGARSHRQTGQRGSDKERVRGKPCGCKWMCLMGFFLLLIR